MASHLKSLSEYNAEHIPNAEGKKFAIIVADYNSNITYSLLKSCLETLEKHGTKEKDISVNHVPGAYELPLGAKLAFDRLQPDAVICLGCVITGETKHDDYINSAVAQGIMRLNLDYSRPFVFGLLTPRNLQQAEDRAGGKHGNKGVEAAITALKMV